jgi:hypothetical protein
MMNPEHGDRLSVKPAGKFLIQSNGDKGETK